MPSFRPPANTLDPYQLELCASIFGRTWSEIVPRGYRLPEYEVARLQAEISKRLTELAAQGLSDPETLQWLTIATVGLRERKRRRSSRRFGTPGPIGV
jgi:hypothetical protein